MTLASKTIYLIVSLILLYLVFKTRKNDKARQMIPYFLASFLGEHLSIVIISMGYFNIWFVNVYLVFEYLTLIYLFYKWFPTPLMKRWIMIFSMIQLIVFSWELWTQSFHLFFIKTNYSQSLIFIFLATIGLLQFLSKVEESLNKLGEFWFLMGLLLYNSYHFIQGALSYLMSTMEVEIPGVTYYIAKGLNTLVVLFFIKSVLCFRARMQSV